jgi:hypothetical protein
VPAETLRLNWVDGAEVLYIGKADQLRPQLRQFADFGAGKPIGHWGGPLIWQMAESETLLVAWKETPGEVPVAAEAALIADFRAALGKPPYANDPHRLGWLTRPKSSRANQRYQGCAGPHPCGPPSPIPQWFRAGPARRDRRR